MWCVYCVSLYMATIMNYRLCCLAMMSMLWRLFCQAADVTWGFCFSNTQWRLWRWCSNTPKLWSFDACTYSQSAIHVVCKAAFKAFQTKPNQWINVIYFNLDSKFWLLMEINFCRGVEMTARGCRERDGNWSDFYCVASASGHKTIRLKFWCAAWNTSNTSAYAGAVL